MQNRLDKQVQDELTKIKYFNIFGVKVDKNIKRTSKIKETSNGTL